MWNQWGVAAGRRSIDEAIRARVLDCTERATRPVPSTLCSKPSRWIPTTARRICCSANLFLLKRDDNPSTYDEKAEHHFREVLRIQASDDRLAEQSLVARRAQRPRRALRSSEALSRTRSPSSPRRSKTCSTATRTWLGETSAGRTSRCRTTSSAIDALVRAVKLHPRFCVGYYRLGLAYLKTREFEKAEQALTQAIEADKRCNDVPGCLALARGSPHEPRHARRRARPISSGAWSSTPTTMPASRAAGTWRLLTDPSGPENRGDELTWKLSKTGKGADGRFRWRNSPRPRASPCASCISSRPTSIASLPADVFVRGFLRAYARALDHGRRARARALWRPPDARAAARAARRGLRARVGAPLRHRDRALHLVDPLHAGALDRLAPAPPRCSARALAWPCHAQPNRDHSSPPPSQRRLRRSRSHRHAADPALRQSRVHRALGPPQQEAVRRRAPAACAARGAGIDRPRPARYARARGDRARVSARARGPRSHAGGLRRARARCAS